MRLSHIHISMPKGGEEIARAFYSGQPGLGRIPKPQPLRVRGGVWFDAGGLDIHLSVEEHPFGPDVQRHFASSLPTAAAIRVYLFEQEVLMSRSHKTTGGSAGASGPRTIDQLAQEQGVPDAQDLNVLIGGGADLWESDQDFAEFVSGIEQRREEGRKMEAARMRRESEL